MASYGAERTARRARTVCRHRRRFYKRLIYTEFRPGYRAFTYTFCVTAQKKGAYHGSLATYSSLRGYRGRTHPNRIGSRSTAQGACLHATAASTAVQLDRLLCRRICRRRVARQQWRRIHRSWQHHTQLFFGRCFCVNIVPSHSWSDNLGSSFIGGGTLGCNWQPVGSSFVLGLEGEFGYLKLSGEAFDPNTLAGTQTNLDVLGSAKVGNWYGMFTGRLGYAFDRVLLYVKGGAAFVRTEASVLDQCVATGCGNWLISTSGSETVTTWTVGGGVEWAFAPNWSVKGEYMFIGLNNHEFQTSGLATTGAGAVVSGGPFVFNHSFNGINTAKIGLNYKFY